MTASVSHILLASGSMSSSLCNCASKCSLTPHSSSSALRSTAAVCVFRSLTDERAVVCADVTAERERGEREERERERAAGPTNRLGSALRS